MPWDGTARDERNATPASGRAQRRSTPPSADGDVGDLNLEALSVRSDSGNSAQSEFAGFSPRRGPPKDGGDDDGRAHNTRMLYRIASGHATFAPPFGFARNRCGAARARERNRCGAGSVQTAGDQIAALTANARQGGASHEPTPMDVDATDNDKAAPHGTNTSTNKCTNKCSNDSSSEFAEANTRRYHKRMPLLKNTLAPDAFERSSPMLGDDIKPQMTVEEKMAAWRCDAEFSDVEDVHAFDNRFKTYAKMQRNADGQPPDATPTEQPSTSSAARAAHGRSTAAPRSAAEAMAALYEAPGANAPNGQLTEAQRHKKDDCYKLFILYKNEIDKGERTNDVDDAAAEGAAAALQDASGDEKASLIKMHLDFSKEKPELKLKDRARELFKTPHVPTRHMRYCQTPEPPPADASAALPPSPTIAMDSALTGASSVTLPAVLPDASHPHRDEAAVVVVAQGAEAAEPGIAYHQQHEFCSYLGLTGMSTATAINTAAAELAACNPARRSLRVQRLQQQQDKIKKGLHIRDGKKPPAAQAANASSAPNATSPHQGCHDVPTARGMESDDDDSEAVSLPACMAAAQSSPPPPENNDDDEERRVPPASKIKILYQLPADKSGDAQSSAAAAKKCAKRLVAPFRHSLQQHIRARAQLGAKDNAPGARSPQHESVRGSNGDSVSSPTATKAPPKRKDDMPPANKQAEEERLGRVRAQYQGYLKASRDVKPSIFIVKCVDNPRRSPRNMANAATTSKAASSQHAIGPASAPVDAPTCMETTPHTSTPAPLPHAEAPLPLGVTNAKPPPKVAHKLQTRQAQAAAPPVTHPAAAAAAVAPTAEPPRLHWGIQRRQLPDRPMDIVMNIEPSGSCKRANTAEANATPYKQLRLAPPAVLDCPEPMDEAYEHITADNDVVVVSSTTNNFFDEPVLQWKVRMPSYVELQQADADTHLDHDNVAANYRSSPAQVEQCPLVVLNRDNCTQCDTPPPLSQTCQSHTTQSQTSPLQTQLTVPHNAHVMHVPRVLRFLNTGDRKIAQEHPNPLHPANGAVLHIFLEMDTLVVVQDMMVTFLKRSKLLQLLSLTTKNNCRDDLPSPAPKTVPERWPFNAQTQNDFAHPHTDWLIMGECARAKRDSEVPNPYSSRICIHNALPVYLELLCYELPKERRECNLVSMYVNVYCYNEIETNVRMNSVALDGVESLVKNITYTTLAESRYFVVAWLQENLLGKKLTGMCKYSLTPKLDTLASIREFKSIRYQIHQLECMKDNKLLGFGDTELTVWDYRSGDVLMHYDFTFTLGRNLGWEYYPNQDTNQTNMILLFQFIMLNEQPPELWLIACNVSHALPTHRVLMRQELPSPAFDRIITGVSTGDHLIITASNDEEMWVDWNNPNLWTRVPSQNTQRFYAHGRPYVVEVTPEMLCIDSISNHMLKVMANLSKSLKNL